MLSGSTHPTWQLRVLGPSVSACWALMHTCPADIGCYLPFPRRHSYMQFQRLSAASPPFPRRRSAGA
eukprot:9284043-Pyramimonas_sp.AAC.1